MNSESGDDAAFRAKSGQGRVSGRTKSKLAALAVAALVGIYSVAAPHINERFGLDLPQLRSDDRGRVEVVNEPEDSAADDRDFVATGAADSRPATNERQKTAGSTSSSSTRSRGPLADRMRSSAKKDPPSSPNTRSTPPPSDDDALYGLLREVSRDRYMSPAGLMYAPGSAEGHRLEHLRRHTKDDPGRPGSHGVFDGEMEGALKTIDLAYERAKKGNRTTKKTDQGRTIYTVDMGGRVGYIGGRDGNRKRKPMARRVRIVLEGNRVITAYPM